MTDVMNFEQALDELEQIVERLQQDTVPLDEAVALFRRGSELAQHSETLLARAELQVQQLTQVVRERFTEYSFPDDENQAD